MTIYNQYFNITNILANNFDSFYSVYRPPPAFPNHHQLLANRGGGLLLYAQDECRDFIRVARAAWQFNRLWGKESTGRPNIIGWMAILTARVPLLSPQLHLCPLQSK